MAFNNFCIFLTGGGAPEMEVSVRTRAAAQTKQGAEQYCWKAFADALELIPYTLAENAGLSPIETVTELRAQHANGNREHGVNVRMVRESIFNFEFYKF